MVRTEVCQCNSIVEYHMVLIMLKFRIQNVNVVIDRLLNSVLFMLREKNLNENDKTTKVLPIKYNYIIMQYYF